MNRLYTVFSFAALFLVTSSPDARAQEVDLAFGLASGESLSVHDLAVDATGDVFVAGSFYGTVRLGDRELTA